MQLKDLIKEGNILIVEQSPESVEEALRMTCSRLIALGKVEERYPEAIIENHNDLGPYYVIAPKIALPHARPEDGVKEGGLQLTIFKKGMDFGNEDNGPAYLSITMAAQDSNGHNATIRSLMNFLSNEEEVDAVIACENSAQILKILAKY